MLYFYVSFSTNKGKQYLAVDWSLRHPDNFVLDKEIVKL